MSPVLITNLTMMPAPHHATPIEVLPEGTQVFGVHITHLTMMPASHYAAPMEVLPEGTQVCTVLITMYCVLSLLLDNDACSPL